MLRIVLPFKTDAAVLESTKAVVGDGHTVGVASQIFEDSIVRSEARRLRRKLQEFYETIGKGNLVLIGYRPGSYVPVFKMRGEDSTPPALAPRPGDAFTQRPELRVAVLPFVDLSTGALSGAWAQFLTDDLIHQLVRTDGVRVITGYLERPEGLETVDIPSLAKKLDVQRIAFDQLPLHSGNAHKTECFDDVDRDRFVFKM